MFYPMTELGWAITVSSMTKHEWVRMVICMTEHEWVIKVNGMTGHEYEHGNDDRLVALVCQHGASRAPD